MFVSSYSTYVYANTSNREVKEKTDNTKEGEALSYKVAQQPKTDTETTSLKSLPVDYIYKNQSFNNKLEIKSQQYQLQSQDNEEVVQPKELVKGFMGNKIIENSKQAYADNSETFSLYRQPQPTQDQTPRTDRKFTRDVQELQSQNMRAEMVNTYAQNDRYYQVTA